MIMKISSSHLSPRLGLMSTYFVVHVVICGIIFSNVHAYHKYALNYDVRVYTVKSGHHLFNFVKSIEWCISIPNSFNLGPGGNLKGNLET